MLPKMCIIFTGAMAALLVGPHSAAAQWHHDPVASAARKAYPDPYCTNIYGGYDWECRRNCDQHYLEACRQYNAEYYCNGFKLPGTATGGYVFKPGGNADADAGCRAEAANCRDGACPVKACTAGANGASCQNGGTAFGYTGYTSESIAGLRTANNCGCNCATGYEGANCQTANAKACTGHVGWGSIRHYSAHESPCNRDVFVGKLNEGEGYYWSTYPNGAGWCRSISREGVTELKKQLESRSDWVHLGGAESEYGRTYFPPTPTTTCVACKAGGSANGGVSLVDGKCQAWCSNSGYCGTGDAYKTSDSTDCRTTTCVPPANGAQFLKAGDEEEAQLPFANVVDADADPTAATTTTNTQPTPAEVARTVFAGIIAACGLYVVWVVARKTPPSNSNKDVLDAPENMAEISEI